MPGLRRRGSWPSGPRWRAQAADQAPSRRARRARATRTSRSTGTAATTSSHYDLEVTYDPATDLLEGEATIRARATQSLSSFNLDLQGLTVHSIEVDGRSASWGRDGSELTVTPRKGLRKRESFKVEVRYSGVPETLEDGSGFIHTDDGTLVVGQPHVAATWYPVNDHPTDKASYTFEITVPAGLEAVANGELEDRKTRRGWTTWTWDAREPMASYLTTATIGGFDLSSYKRDGIRYWDAIDNDLLAPPASPRTGRRFAISQRGMPSYKRLQRTISVPSGGATVSFWVTRDTEPNWDFFFVEAHTVGMNDWTTLPDLNGHTSQDTGSSCPFWLFLHPFLAHYQTDNGDGTCGPTGDTGAWHAVSGWSDGYEQWRVDLSAFAGRTVELSLTYASDDIFQRQGVFVDDIVVSTGRRLDLVRKRREHDGRLDGARRARRQRRAEPERLDRRHRRRHARAARHRGAAGVRDAGRRRRVPRAHVRRLPVLRAGRDRGRRQGRRLRAREPDAADLRRQLLLRPGRRPRTSSSTSSRTSGSATASPSRAGSTSGSTRASPPTPSGCGRSTPAAGRPRRRSTSGTASSLRTTRSGRSRSAIPGRASSSSSRSTPGAR